MLVLVIRALLLGICTRAPDCWKLSFEDQDGAEEPRLAEDCSPICRRTSEVSGRNLTKNAMGCSGWRGV